MMYLSSYLPFNCYTLGFALRKRREEGEKGGGGGRKEGEKGEREREEGRKVRRRGRIHIRSKAGG